MINLISCANCGIVLDKNRISISMYVEDADDYGVIDPDFAIWDGKDYQPAFYCPCCKTKIMYETGEYDGNF